VNRRGEAAPPVPETRASGALTLQQNATLTIDGRRYWDRRRALPAGDALSFQDPGPALILGVS